MNKLTQNNIFFDWTLTVLNIVFFAGLFLDFWHHVHMTAGDSGTFFTPTHYLFYIAFICVTAFFLYTFLARSIQGKSILAILPPGYNLSAVGLMIFAAGGFIDFAWHNIFGVEKSIDAFLSPAHLIIAIGFTLIITGPIRSMLFHQLTGFIRQLPALIALIMTVSLFQILTQHSHAMVALFPTMLPFNQFIFKIQALGVSSLLLQTAIYLAAFLFLVKHNRLLPGYFSLILIPTTFLILFMSKHSVHINYYLIFFTILSAIICDLLILSFKSLHQNINFWYLIFIIFPILFNSCYFLALFLTTNVYWSIHLYTGVIMEAGILGFLMSYLILSPPFNKKE